MVNNKKLQDPKLISFQMENEQLQEFQKVVSNYQTTRSDFIRKLIDNAINNSYSNISELKQIRNEKIKERNILNNEIEQLNKEINLLLDKQQVNENNNNVLNELMETINNVSINENGITKERIKFIGGDKIRHSLLINECKKQGIKIIKENERMNSKYIDETPQKEEKPIIKIYNMFVREFKGQRTYKEPIKLLDKQEKKYKMMCDKKGINYNEFKGMVNNAKNNK